MLTPWLPIEISAGREELADAWLLTDGKYGEELTDDRQVEDGKCREELTDACLVEEDTCTCGATPPPCARLPWMKRRNPRSPLKANIDKTFSSGCPLVSGKKSSAAGTNTVAMQPKSRSVPPTPSTERWSIHGVRKADARLAGPQLMKVASPTAFPRTRSGMISGTVSYTHLTLPTILLV